MCVIKLLFNYNSENMQISLITKCVHIKANIYHVLQLHYLSEVLLLSWCNVLVM